MHPCGSPMSWMLPSSERFDAGLVRRDRSKRPGMQANRDSYVHITERRPDGIVIRGTKAIVTGAPYVHEFLVMPCRQELT